MGLYRQTGSENWYYKFKWKGDEYRKSTGTTNKRKAAQIESKVKSDLAMGAVGIVERKAAPTLADFADEKFLPFVRATKAEKPRTVTFYETTVKNLKSFPKLANMALDRITSEVLGEFVAKRQELGMKVSTINRELATVRRMFNLAQEWGHVSTLLPRVRLNPGEIGRMRVLSVQEEDVYLAAARGIGLAQDIGYEKALSGIRATVRGEKPLKPDSYLLYDVAMILLDCGLRPDECYRLQWPQVHDGGIHIQQGKGKGSRRRVPVTPRVLAILEMRRAATAVGPDAEKAADGNSSERNRTGATWVFARDTISGHIEGSTINEQHDKARTAAGLPEVVVYDFRHTRITRWAKTLPLPVVQRLAGHTSIATTMRYVHISDDDVVEAMAKEQEAKRGHSLGHSGKEDKVEQATKPS